MTWVQGLKLWEERDALIQGCAMLEERTQRAVRQPPAAHVINMAAS